MTRLLRLLKSFRTDDAGNIAMMFGFAIMAILAGAGIALDMARARMFQSEIQEASDAAVLAAARYKSTHANAPDSELTVVGRRVFDAHMTGKDSLSFTNFAIDFNPATGVFALDADGEIETVLLGVFGRPAMAVDPHAEVKLSKSPYIELVMALDTTGSMSAKGKIDSLKEAATDLVETLFAFDDANVRIGVVPFAQYASVGEDYNSAAWLSNPGGAFKGCIGSRPYPFNTTDEDYNVHLVPGLNGATCPDPILPLTDDEVELEDVIDDLDPSGWTYIPAGLSLGWAALSPQAPFSEGVAYDALAGLNGIKALLLMTDGMNTRAPDYPTHNKADELLANDLTKELCVNIKKEKIVVYTIAFDVSDADIRKVLEDCASTPGNYFNATDKDALIEAFGAISGSLREISLSK